MDTAGTIQIEIPAVVTPDGQVNASYWTDEDGNDITDVGIMYEHFPIDTPTKLVTVKAEIDLDELFRAAEVDSEIDLNKADQP
jgi:hypothetical protein